MSSADPVKPTLTEVARRAGVGRSSAARVLGGYGSVSAKTRERVLAAAAALGYEANELARSMSTGITMTVGVVLADIGNPFFSGVLRGVSDTLRAAGYGTILVSSDENADLEDEAIRLLLAKQVDGLIVAPSGGRGAAARALRGAVERGVPVVQVDRTVGALPADAVVMDNRDAAREATDYLLAAGHRRIALVWGPECEDGTATPGILADAAMSRELTSVGERYLGYADAFADAGLPLDPALVMTRDQTIDGVHRFVRSLLRGTPPTAVITTEQDAAIAAIAELRRAGIRVPRDVSLVAFDDAPWASVFDPPITTVRQPVQELGRRAAERLLARMAGDSSPAVVTHLSSELVDRKSVRRLLEEDGSSTTRG